LRLAVQRHLSLSQLGVGSFCGARSGVQQLLFQKRRVRLREQGAPLQIRKLTANRQQPNWDFSTLFLVKDSLAVMLESASLLEDALREYAELEALYLTTLPPFPGIPNAPLFGTPPPSDSV